MSNLVTETLTPLHDTVIVELLEAPQAQTSGLIIVPGDTQFTFARVLAAGNGYLTESGNRTPLSVKVGDVVILDPNNTYKPVKFENQPVVIIKERQIVSVCAKPFAEKF